MLLEFDQVLFEWINVSLSSPVLDSILIPLRNKYVWIPVYIFIISFSLINKKIKGYYFVVFLILTVGIADMLSNKLIKKTVQRPRPCQVMSYPDIDLKVKCGSGYSFTSNHAANHFSLSIFLFLLLGKSTFRKYRIVLLIWASLVSFAQVYVGVHYPSDVIAGALVGVFIGSLGFSVYSNFKSGFLPRYEKKS